ncbi:MAG: bifunctional glutamate N-acetyltransferase/amino-acid acetyltransferase ArgJ [Agarilytica sp.]
MAVGEEYWQDLPAIKGLKLGVAKAGIKYPDRTDLAVILLCDGATVAGVFTQNAYAAAPVDICRQHLSSGDVRALVVNSGNANACTGEAGAQAALQSCEALAKLISSSAQEVLPFSTGVIGELLPIDKITLAIPDAVADASESQWSDFAKAIMTTDTRPKGASASFEWDGSTIHVSGVAKGSGMINPNMATMLAYVATDAGMSLELLSELSVLSANKSFNRITIDGDTSTNDSSILIATGAASTPKITDKNDALYKKLAAAVIEVNQSLAQQIVEDGEGATKFVTVDVGGGENEKECFDVAYAIAHSPLVKTAMFAADPNWGRIVAAIGYAGVESLDANKVRVWLDDVTIVEHGGKAASYKEEDGQRVFDQERFTIKVDLGRGDAAELLWTTDLSHEYIRINAEYRS